METSLTLESAKPMNITKLDYTRLHLKWLVWLPKNIKWKLTLLGYVNKKKHKHPNYNLTCLDIQNQGS